MTHLSSHLPSTRTHRLARLKLFSYIPVVLICIGCARSGSEGQHTVSSATLRAQLQPLSSVGTYASFDLNAGILYIGNDSLERWIRLDQGTRKIQTIRYAHRPSGKNYLDRPSGEFRFRIGELVFSGDRDLLTYNDYQIVQRMGGGKRVTIQFTYTSGEEAQPTFYLWVHYEIYPDLPVVRKWLTVQNLTDSAFFLEDITIESLPLFAGSVDKLQIWRYGIAGMLGEPLSPPWEGDTSDTFVLVGDSRSNSGVVLGNQSAGLLKHYTVYSDRETVSVGLMPTTAINGTEIRVPSGQSVNSPKVWTMLVEDDLQSVIETVSENSLMYVLPYFEDTKRQIPDIRWIVLETEWEKSIPSIRPGSLIAIDYDWNIEKLKTVKRISQWVHERGGRFGMRLPIAEMQTAILDRPEWRLVPVPVVQWRTSLKDQHVEEKAGQAGAQQPAAHAPAPVIYCVLSDYGYYLTQAVKTLLEEISVDLLILDRPILGAEHNLLKGCDALGHQHHTRAESIGVVYRWLFEFADHLRREYPALQLGITASAYGVEQVDAACLTHFDLFFDP